MPTDLPAARHHGSFLFRRPGDKAVYAVRCRPAITDRRLASFMGRKGGKAYYGAAECGPLRIASFLTRRPDGKALYAFADPCCGGRGSGSGSGSIIGGSSVSGSISGSHGSISGSVSGSVVAGSGSGPSGLNCPGGTYQITSLGIINSCRVGWRVNPDLVCEYVIDFEGNGGFTCKELNIDVSPGHYCCVPVPYPQYLYTCATCGSTLLPNWVRVTITGTCPNLPATPVVVYATHDSGYGSTPAWRVDASGIDWGVFGWIHCGGSSPPGYCEGFGFQGGFGCGMLGVAFVCGVFVNQSTIVHSCNPLKFEISLYGGVFNLLVEDFVPELP